MSPRAQRGLAAAAIAALVVGAYARIGQVTFLLDDNFGILRNQSIRSLRAVGVWFAPSAHAPTAGRPILNLSFALNYAAGGLHLGGYHAVNVALHLAAALLLFGVARQSFELLGGGSRVAARATPWAAAAAILWALHPVQTDSVTYLSQRAEELVGVWLLAALYCRLRAERTGHPRAWLGASAAACLAGMMSKETMASAPLVLWLFDRCFLTGGWWEALRRRPLYYAALAATWIWLPIALRGGSVRGVGFDAGTGSLSYALTEAEVAIRYLGLAVWPHPLVFDYGPWQDSAARAAPFLAAIAALLILTVWALRARPRWGFFPACFFLLLAPTSTFIPIAVQPMAESRLYLPLAPLIVGAVAALAVAGVGRAAWIAGIVAGAWALLTVARNEVYRDPLRLWTENERIRPDNYRSHNHRGVALLHEKRFAEAIQEQREALRLRGADPDLLGDLGVALEDGGHSQEALPVLEWSLRLNPSRPAAHYDLGRALADVGRLSEAETQYRESLRLDPELENVHNNLGLVLMDEGKSPEAEEQFRIALSQPISAQQDHAVMWYDYGVLLSAEKKADQAEHAYRSAIALNPRFALAWRNLGVELFHTGQWAAAADAFRAEQRADPSDRIAAANLAAALKMLGQ